MEYHKGKRTTTDDSGMPFTHAAQQVKNHGVQEPKKLGVTTLINL